MMNTVILSFQAIFPLMAYMALGYFLNKRGYFPERVPQAINKIVFKILLPINIFNSIFTTNLAEAFRWDVALYVGISCIISFLTITFIVKRIEKTRDFIPVMIQGIHKANYNLLSVSIVSSFFGSAIGMTAVLVAIITPIVNTCSAITFESNLGKERTSVAVLAKKTLKNPLVLGSLVGVAANLCHLPIPKFILSGVIKNLSGMATPLALLTLGATLEFSSLKRYAKQLSIVAAGKLVLLPAVILPIAILIGIRGADLLAVTIYCASPTAVNSYSTAVSMGGNEELAGDVVIVTSVLSILTLFLWMCLLGSLGVI